MTFIVCSESYDLLILGQTAEAKYDFDDPRFTDFDEDYDDDDDDEYECDFDVGLGDRAAEVSSCGRFRRR